jgi:hypothetical protein
MEASARNSSRPAFLAIICITTAPALGIGLKNSHRGVGGSHEPLHVLELDG